MEKEYIQYTAQQLLNEDTFLAAEKGGTGEDKKYWDELARKDAKFAHELQTARFILKRMEKRAAANRLTQKEETSIWQQIEQSKYAYKQQNRRLWKCRSLAVAASVFIIGFTIYKFLSPTPEEFDYSSFIVQNSDLLKEKEQDITLILSDEEEINLSGKEATVGYQDGYIEINTDSGEKKKAEDVKDSFNQLIVPKGKRSFVTMADGTQMWVNAGTIVVYPTLFTGNKREIYVEGEVYLDVTPNKEKPFIVKTKEMHVEVLGTQFNVSAYKEDNSQHVILVEGKVEVALPDKSRKIMKPDQQLTYQNNQCNIQTVDNLDQLAWRFGYYQYKNQTIAEVIKGLTKYYGETIVFDEKAGKMICSGKLDLKNDLHEVLTTLADAASLQLDYHENNIHLYVKP